MARYAVLIMRVNPDVTVGRMDRAIEETLDEGWDAIEAVTAPIGQGPHSEHTLCVAVVDAENASDVGWRIGATA